MVSKPTLVGMEARDPREGAITSNGGDGELKATRANESR